MRALVVASDTQVVGREDELALLREFVSALAQGARAMGIRGEPGIGKTTLWRAALEIGEAAGLAVLSAGCVEAELPLAFVGLSDLVHEALPAVADELSDHDRAALVVAVGLEAPQGRRGDATAVSRAFLTLLRLVARDRPALVAVDDVQWLDMPSRRALAFAARRRRRADRESSSRSAATGLIRSASRAPSTRRGSASFASSR